MKSLEQIDTYLDGLIKANTGKETSQAADIEEAITKAQNDLDSATAVGDVDAYETASKHLEKARLAQRMSGVREKLPLLTDEEYASLIQETEDIANTMQEKLLKQAREVIKPLKEIAESSRQINISVNSILHKLQYDAYRDKDFRETNITLALTHVPSQTSAGAFYDNRVKGTVMDPDNQYRYLPGNVNRPRVSGFSKGVTK